MTLQVTSDNYAIVAATDDAQTVVFSIATEDIGSTSRGNNERDPEKVAARERRIAEAVKRSKLEYKTEHAFTERRWVLDSDQRLARAPARQKIDRQQLEYLTTALYYSSPPEYQQALRLILDVFDPGAKSLGGISRELVDIGIRCAIFIGDTEHAIQLADSTRSLWRTWSGAAEIAADAYNLSGRYHDAVRTLLMATANSLQIPLLRKLEDTFRLLYDEGRPHETKYKEIEILRALIRRIIHMRSESFIRPLFEEITTKDAHETTPEVPQWNQEPLSVEALAIELGLGEDRGDLEKTLERLQRAAGGDGEKEVVEKSVRDL
ncbi:hypothetical protein M231_07661 [Tremella mesenterica]|uniref:Uncharacterized protein n=1 Tax=Tremella mesenterica TaxID=5217 RepID=A0A4Q1BBN6_TREME|nr:hypothetical protein M231_07661 [Tremella mesenterica]